MLSIDGRSGPATGQADGREREEGDLNAKRAATRAARIERTARLEAEGKRASQWPREG